MTFDVPAPQALVANAAPLPKHVAHVAYLVPAVITVLAPVAAVQVLQLSAHGKQAPFVPSSDKTTLVKFVVSQALVAEALAAAA